MILPNKFGAKKKAADPPKSKYENPTQVKMFLMSVDDIFTNRYKNGWFTLLKFTEAVIEKPHLLEEVKEFSKNHKFEDVTQFYKNVRPPVQKEEVKEEIVKPKPK